ncbi:1919_t:CDS:2 [Racocetra fulgida]|uniref:1919_t:CDS:1 n=1 Tax=Racocetra fulgida TaxID=60492 RepID=A0A9N8VR92_9GLOM|nr:1919_t:CDS:2 [Racocetra fulgida]
MSQSDDVENDINCPECEFIEFSNIEGFEYVAKGGFGSVYEGYWMEGPRWIWDEVSAIWCRNGPTKVALKKLDDSQEPSMNFFKQDETGCFMFVMRYYENGNLYDYLDSNKGIISWRDMVDMLWGIAGGLERIHSEGFFHSNLHGGNLLVEDDTISIDAKIADELGNWIHAICDDPNPSEISNNFGIAEEKRWKKIKREIENKTLSKDLIHEDAIYISRIFDFSMLQK